MRYLIIIIFTSLLGLNVNASDSFHGDTTKSIIDKAKIQLKITEAKGKYYAHNYRGALNLYREILSIDKNNARAHYGISECQYSLNKYSTAQKHIEKAFKMDAEVDKDVKYMMSLIYFRQGDLDKALENMEAFKAVTTNKKQLEDYSVNLIIAQINYAKKAINEPVDVTIENLGGKINTTAPEFAPCISPDGKMMVFTSRRVDTKGGRVDVDFDHQYYSDIYLSNWNEETNDWGEADNISGSINTEYHDGGLSFAPTGELIIYRNIMNVTRSGDIYISKRSKSGKWGKPKEIIYKDPKVSKKINSSYFESSASITGDGNTIYFVSERPDGNGQADIYYVKKDGRVWSDPINLGAPINTAFDEKCVFIHPSGNVIFFTSNGFEEGVGAYDVYYSVKEDDTWSQPKNMGYPINTVKEEKTISVSPDGKTAYIGAYYDIDSKGDADIFKIDISKLGIPTTPYVAPLED